MEQPINNETGAAKVPNFLNEVMAATILLGSVGDNPLALPLILSAEKDHGLKCLCYYRLTRNSMEPAFEDLETTEVLDGVLRIKDYFRRAIQSEINLLSIQLKREGEATRLKIMQELSAKHAAGTTAELAARFHLSKAQVRKMRADGTLDAYLLSQEVSEQPC